MSAPLKHAYPAGIGAELRYRVADAKEARRIMSRAHDYAYRRNWIYRCRTRDGVVTVTRVA